MYSRQPTAYVSPSDDIMSPCTKKLSDLKGKRFKKYVFSFWRFCALINCVNSAGKPQSLFTKLGKKSYEQSTSDQSRSLNSTSHWGCFVEPGFKLVKNFGITVYCFFLSVFFSGPFNVPVATMDWLNWIKLDWFMSCWFWLLVLLDHALRCDSFFCLQNGINIVIQSISLCYST